MRDKSLLIKVVGLLVLMAGTSGVMNAQNTVSGIVTDVSDGTPLPGVSVVIRGTTTGMSTDVDGMYSVNVSSLTDSLEFAYLGYERQVVPINGRTEIDIEMVPTVLSGEEIVLVGYASQRQRDVTGSISSVSGDDLEKVGRTSVNQMLLGKAPGLNLRTRTAQPGGGVSVNIRGALSPNGNNTPLYVIDGVPITNNSSSVAGLNDDDLGFYGGIDRDPLSYLNPSDIESISILKDASATAIYGSSAANGVILITTKNGRPGKIQVDYQGSYTFQKSKEYFPLLNSREFMETQDRLAYDRYLYNNNLAPYGSANPNTVPSYTPLFTESDISSAGAGTDWYDVISRDGYINEQTISLSGGDANTRVYTSFNFQDNQAILDNSDLSRYSGRFNIDQDLSEAVNLTVKSTVSRLAGNNASTGFNDGGQEKYNMIQAASNYSPTITAFDDDGNYNYSYDRLIMNPAAFLIIKDEATTNNIFAAPNLEIKFTDKIKVNAVGQIDYASTTRNFYLPMITNNAQLADGMAQKSENTIENYSSEAYATYSDAFNESEITVVLGTGYYKTQSEGFSLQAVGFFTDAFQDNNVGVASELLQNKVNSYKDERTKISQFMRANYTFKDRYILSLVARRDGSSIFAENNRYGFFPGASAAWIISDESFMYSMQNLSSLKLRVGYGLAGNESVLSGNTLQLYSPGYPFIIGETQLNGIALSQIANPDLTWEKITTLNVGLGFGFFRNRIMGSLDLFQRTANDLLDFNALPSNNAVGLVADNVGSTRSEGIELELNTTNFTSKNFQWTSGFNISYYESYWKERNPEVALSDYIGETDELSTIYGWKTDGIIQSESDIPAHMPNAALGNIKYVDVNDDGLLNSEDVVKLGTFAPKWSIGFSNDFNYRNFDLSVFLYGNFGSKVNNNYAPNVFGIYQTTNPSNTTTLAKDVWSADNPDGKYPGVADDQYVGNNPTGNNDFYLEKGDFIRINNINLGYTLPTSVSGMVGGIRSARIFVNLQDIGVLTNYSGFDPELTEVNPYPKSYSTTFGVDIKF